MNEPQAWFTVNFYKFVDLPDFAQLKPLLLACCKRQGVYGLVILANEGINGTLAGSRSSVEAVLAFLRSDSRLAEIKFRTSMSSRQPFFRMNVRLKREIVTMGAPDLMKKTPSGTYVKPEDWNSLLQDPNLILIDARNDYEVVLGTFKGAINPEISNFSQLPRWLDEHARKVPPNGGRTKVAMFCTGGIRCEKSTAYLRDLGYGQVYHLEGGILNYLESVAPKSSLWQGECFVFDDRVSVGHALIPGNLHLCRVCRYPLDQSARTSAEFEEGVSCPNCIGSTDEFKKRGARERQRQYEKDTSRNQTQSNVAKPTALN